MDKQEQARSVQYPRFVDDNFDRQTRLQSVNYPLNIYKRRVHGNRRFVKYRVQSPIQSEQEELPMAGAQQFVFHSEMRLKIRKMFGGQFKKNLLQAIEDQKKHQIEEKRRKSASYLRRNSINTLSKNVPINRFKIRQSMMNLSTPIPQEIVQEQVELPKIKDNFKTLEQNDDKCDVLTCPCNKPEYDSQKSVRRHRHCKRLSQNQLYRLELEKQPAFKFMTFQDQKDQFGKTHKSQENFIFPNESSPLFNFKEEQKTNKSKKNQNSMKQQRQQFYKCNKSISQAFQTQKITIENPMIIQGQKSVYQKRIKHQRKFNTCKYHAKTLDKTIKTQSVKCEQNKVETQRKIKEEADISSDTTMAKSSLSSISSLPSIDNITHDDDLKREANQRLRTHEQFFRQLHIQKKSGTQPQLFAIREFEDVEMFSNDNMSDDL